MKREWRGEISERRDDRKGGDRENSPKTRRDSSPSNRSSLLQLHPSPSSSKEQRPTPPSSRPSQRSIPSPTTYRWRPVRERQPPSPWVEVVAKEEQLQGRASSRRRVLGVSTSSSTAVAAVAPEASRRRRRPLERRLPVRGRRPPCSSTLQQRQLRFPTLPLARTTSSDFRPRPRQEFLWARGGPPRRRVG